MSKRELLSAWSQRPENLFLLFGLFFGLLFSVLTPPFEAPDEYNHFYRIYQISKGELFAQKIENNCGGYIPKSLPYTAYVATDRFAIPFHPGKKFHTEFVLPLLKFPLEKDRQIFVNFPNTAAYSPVAYLPQLPGVLFGKLFNLSPLALMYLGRFTALLVCLWILYHAIRLSAFRWLFLLLALMPMTVFLRSSLSADAAATSLAFLLIALVFQLRQGEKKIRRQEIAVFFFVSLLSALTKQAYFLLSFLYFLIPARRFQSEKERLGLFGIFLGCITALVAAWSDIFRSVATPFLPLPIDAGRQLALVASHPLNFLRVIFHTLSLDTGALVHQFIGVLGWLDTPLPAGLCLAIGLSLFMAAQPHERRSVIFSRWEKTLCALILVGTTILMGLAGYAFNTPVGASVIYGFQGRYFIPVSALFFLLFSFRPLRLGLFEKFVPHIVSAWLLVTLSYTAVTIYGRYFF